MWRKAAAALAGAGGAACVACGAALAHVRRGGRREEVWQAVSLDLEQHRTRSFPSAALSSLALDRNAVRTAAAHLFPIEPLLEAHARSAPWASAGVVRERLAFWAARAREAQELRNKKFGRRLSHNAQGAHIGTPVAPYFEGAALDADGRRKAQAALEEFGVCWVKHALGADEVRSVRAALLLGEGARFEPVREQGQRLKDKDPNLSAARHSFGRLHCLLRGSTFEEPLTAAHAPFLPLVYDFFPSALPPQEERVAVSEMVLVIAAPLALMQNWQRDNGHRGLTVMIPLERVRLSQGSQEVLSGTHRPLREALRALVDAQGPLIPEVWEAGEALVMDSRVLHRGAPNHSVHEAIPMLVLRYDVVNQMAPGQTFFETARGYAFARAAETFFSLYTLLFSASPPRACAPSTAE